MKKIPITLEQYECVTCKRKWYINTEDKINNKMICPYECNCRGNVVRKFDMVIHKYEDYVSEDVETNKNEGVD